MEDAAHAGLRVALMAAEDRRRDFRDLLAREGIRVVLEQPLSGSLPFEWKGAEVLLVSLEGRPEPVEMRCLLAQSPLPVLINQGGVGDGGIWSRQLIGKLRTLAARGLPRARLEVAQQQANLRVIEDAGGGGERPWLIVLGASIGGPRAVARFLQALPDELPVSFLLAQHMSESFQDLLAEQLDRCSHWPVALLGDRQRLEAGQVWLVPADSRIEMRAGREVCRSAQGWNTIRRPDIDSVLSGAAEAFGSRCGAIMFSGLGQDGVRSCELVTRRGGFMWAQSAESCVISNMPEAVRRDCAVEFSGTPEELARALEQRCREEGARPN